MRLPAAAILLLVLVFSAQAQPFSDNYPQASPWWGEARSSLRARTLGGYRAASASRSCLTAATRAVLDRLEARFGAVTILSTCRPGAVIAGTKRPSYHRYGMAVDFVAPRGRKAEVVRWLYGQDTLVMTYARMSHVHFNLGQGARIACGGCGKRKARRVYAEAQ